MGAERVVKLSYGKFRRSGKVLVAHFVRGMETTRICANGGRSCKSSWLTQVPTVTDAVILKAASFMEACYHHDNPLLLYLWELCDHRVLVQAA